MSVFLIYVLDATYDIYLEALTQAVFPLAVQVVLDPDLCMRKSIKIDFINTYNVHDLVVWTNNGAV